MNLIAFSPRASIARALLTASVLACALALPAAAGAVVPAFSLSEPVNNKRVSNQLSIQGYSSNVDVQIQCVFPGNSPGSTNIDCTYLNRYVSIGMTVFGAEGARTLTVTATAQDGSNQQTVVTRNIIVDKTGPVTSINSGPSGGVSVSGTSFQWTFSANETANFWCRIDSDGWEACTSPWTKNGLADGAHTFQVRGDDEAGNNGGTTSASFNVNNAPPEAGISSVNGMGITPDVTKHVNSADVTWGLTKTRNDALLECSLDSGAWEVCTTSGYTATGLSEGLHTLDVRAYLAGPTDVQDPAVRSTINVDVTKPIVNFNGVPQHFAGTDATINWGSNEGSDYSQCFFEGNWFDPCPTSFSGLSGGEHQLYLQVEDLAGNWSDETVFTFWTYPDPPDTTIGAGQSPSTAVASATFSLSSSAGGGTFECRVDGGAWKPCTSPATVKSGEYAAGSHVFEARATDPAGQTDPTPASTAFSLEAPPVVPAPTVSKLSAKGKRLTLTVSGAGTVAVKVETCKKVKRKTRCKRFTTGTAVADAAGNLRITLKKKLKKGSKYRVTVTTTSSTGAVAKTVKTIKAK